MTNDEARESTDCVDFMYKIDERNNTIKFIFSDGIVKTANLGALKEIWDAQSEFKKKAEVVISQLRADRDRLEDAHRWIPCDKRLPDKLQDVLVTFYDAEEEYDVAYMRKTFNASYKAQGSENEWVSSMGETTYADYEVVAWKPIEPYTAESEGA